MASVIEVSGLTKRFGSLTAVNDVSFNVERGEIFGLLGKNGAGKTTTVEILEGCQAPDEGRVSVLGVDPKKGGGAWKDRIGLVLQDSDFDPSHTVTETVKLFAGFFSHPKSVTETLELMVAVRPTFHQPALLAKQAANIDHISNGRLALNVVSSWWEQEARMYGVHFEQHDDRYARTSEWLDVINGVWSQPTFTHEGRYYKTEKTVLEPKPVRKPRPTIYAGGESEAAKNLIAQKCDAYVMHGDSPEFVAAKIADMRERRERFGLEPMQFGVAGYALTRDTEDDVRKEIARITDVQQNAKGFANYEQWLRGTQLEKKMSIEEYSVSNRGLRPNLIGTADQIKERIAAYEAAGLDLLLLQMSPQLEEMERFSAQVIQPVGAEAVVA